MAIIKCPECGRGVSDKAVSCPHCGFNISSVNICEECNAIINEDEASCPNCGSPTPWSRKCPGCGSHVLNTEDTCPECGFNMRSYYGRSNILVKDTPTNLYQYSDTEYSTEEDIEKPSKKKRIIYGAVLISIIGVIIGMWSHREHQLEKVAQEKHAADSIRAEEERIAAAIEAKEAERARMEAEYNRIEEERLQRIRQQAYIEAQISGVWAKYQSIEDSPYTDGFGPTMDAWRITPESHTAELIRIHLDEIEVLYHHYYNLEDYTIYNSDHLKLLRYDPYSNRVIDNNGDKLFKII